MQKIQLIDAETLYYKPLEHPRMLIDGILSDELGKDRPNLANGLWSRSLLRQKKKTLVIVFDDTRSSKLLYCLIHPIAKG